jgi:hypothetical protein
VATKTKSKDKAAKRKKAGGLAAAATKRLERIGGPKMTPEQVAHALIHMEERGDAERVPLDDGTWGWRVQGPQGVQILKPTAEMLAALERFQTEGHPPHDDE